MTQNLRTAQDSKTAEDLRTVQDSQDSLGSRYSPDSPDAEALRLSGGRSLPVVGIDRIEYYSPNRFLDLDDLAAARGVDPAKYRIGIGQRRMAVPTLDQDIVAMGANAAERMLGDEDKRHIGLVIVATESGIDQSKASALFVQDVLGLDPHLRAIEIKEACYGGTAGLQLAADFVRSHPHSTALVIAADIARYGLRTGGEVTQGAGAVAMLVSVDPHILALEHQSVYRSASTGDFWRPNYATEAMAKGKYSEQVYLTMLDEIWTEAEQRGMTRADDLQALLFHIPFTKMGRKGLLGVQPRVGAGAYERLTRRFEASIVYGRNIGNIYTGSLYLSLISLLDTDTSLREGDRIGLFSYGSGSVAELLFGVLQQGFRERLQPHEHRRLLEERQRLSVEEYEDIFEQHLVCDGSTQVLEVGDHNAPHRLVKLERHERVYR